MGRLLAGVRAVGFDLDGTLVDSAPDIAAAANATLAHLGLAPVPEARVALAIGDGLDMLIERTMTESAGGAPSPNASPQASPASARNMEGALTWRAASIRA